MAVLLQRPGDRKGESRGPAGRKRVLGELAEIKVDPKKKRRSTVGKENDPHSS